MKKPGIETGKILLIGIGNNARSDDGLGWKFVEMIQEKGYDFVDCELRYQLDVEDCLLVCKYETVVFADACQVQLANGFDINECSAAAHYFFSSHKQTPETVLYLANKLYDKFPQAYTLAISGCDWSLNMALSEPAQRNLHAAVSFFTKKFLPGSSKPSSARTVLKT